ncbi:MAG TPA: radical SAM protein [Bryobacteraceae bacterium]|jgi:MoaA/NifB/PqqE/SkfB family radical SAM enzyme|nr:radical SAM protein [Bryobacteraceae bacterium]
MHLNPVLTRLPILILSPHARCNCRCVMCDIWKVTDAAEISPEDLERHVAAVEGMGVEWAVFTGGEPLMHSDLFRLCGILRARGIRITILSTGLLLEKHAAAIVANVDDVIVSLDGPAEVHDAIRRVPGAFARLDSGVRAIHRLRPDFSVTARCTVQRLNHVRLRDTIAAAREIGLSGISFLAADVTSTAFNRLEVWAPGRQSSIAVAAEDVSTLESEMEAIIAANECRTFVAESPEKLHRIVDHFKGDPVAPLCNAPWVSVVVEADGVVRPCFFHRPIGKLDDITNLADVINGAEATTFRAALDVAADPTCRRCVCSLNHSPATEER